MLYYFVAIKLFAKILPQFCGNPKNKNKIATTFIVLQLAL
jgi:hypothetical protein